jgi:hypothetical protein
MEWAVLVKTAAKPDWMVLARGKNGSDDIKGSAETFTTKIERLFSLTSFLSQW